MTPWENDMYSIFDDESALASRFPHAMASPPEPEPEAEPETESESEPAPPPAPPPEERLKPNTTNPLIKNR